MRSRRLGIAAIVILAVPVGLAGCVAVAPVRSQTCVSWVWFDTPADAAADADATVAGRVIERTGTANIFGVDASVWSIDVEEWITGDGPATTEVVSTPVTCTAGGAHPDGDPLEAALAHERVIVFVYDRDQPWRTITPLQGVVPAAPDGGLPADWPDE
jgi:hypothetical protein